MNIFKRKILALSTAFIATAIAPMLFRTINADTIEYDVWVNGE